jgi:hypothetical protein
MAIATGVAKSVRIKAESAWGTAAGTSGGQVLRRTSSDLALVKDTYQSAEVRSDYQVVDYRHGVRRVEGSISGQLSPGTYSTPMAAVVRRAFGAVSAITGLGITITGSSAPYTIARASGSWLTDGIKVGMVGRFTAGSLAAANLNKNILVTAVTASNITGVPLGGLSLTAEGPVASCTFTPTGKVTYIPSSGHTDTSYSIEHWHADIAQSELYVGCKIDSMDLNLPPTGMATVGFGVLGKDVTTAASVYYTSPTAETSTGLVAAVNGALYLGGSAVARLTGLTINLKGNMSGEAVVGSNTFADITEGNVEVSGQMTVLFQDATERDYFINETEVSLVAVLTTSGAAAADFVSFVLPRIKVGGASNDDGIKGLTRTMPFVALRNTSGGTGISSEDTTFWIQDSQA